LSRENTIEKLKSYLINGQEEDAEKAAREILDAGIDPLEVMETELFPAMKSVGEKFEKGE
jgi:methanogenic corrinoid protein MtbC1